MFFMPVKAATPEETDLTFHVNYPPLREDFSHVLPDQVIENGNENSFFGSLLIVFIQFWKPSKARFQLRMHFKLKMCNIERSLIW